MRRKFKTDKERVEARQKRQLAYYKANADKMNRKRMERYNKSKEPKPLEVPAELTQAIEAAAIARQQKKHQDIIQSCVANGNKETVLREFDKEFGQ